MRLAIAVLAFVAVSAIAGGVATLTGPAGAASMESMYRIRKRRRGLRASVRALLARPGAPLAHSVLRVMGASGRRRAVARLDAAGHPEDMGLEEYAHTKASAAILSAVPAIVSYLSGRWLLAISLLLLGWLSVDISLLLGARARRETVRRDLPYFLEVLSLATRSGLPLARAWEWGGDIVQGPLGVEVRTVIADASARGTGIDAALASFAERVRVPAIGQLASILRASYSLGTPLAERLHDVAEQLRRASARDTRRRSARITARISLITLTTIVPATLLLVVAVMLGNSDVGALFGQLLAP